MLRNLLRNKVQFFSIFIMSFLGLFVFVGMDSEVAGFTAAEDAFYKEGRTVVMVTHNSSCAGIADRVIKVKNARIKSDERIEHPKDAMEINW